jgi:hypothetical protein
MFIIGNMMGVDQPQSKLGNGDSDDYIQTNNLQLENPDHAVEFLYHKINTLVPRIAKKQYTAQFDERSCLERRLGYRQTAYEPDQLNNLKVLLAVSGAGKTRLLLELLYKRRGYYFVSPTRDMDLGSGDLAYCSILAAEDSSRSFYYIQLLFFVRVTVCNYLVEHGYETHELLLAQIHPEAFFGMDLFMELFDVLTQRKDVKIGRTFTNCFDFVAIDEIQTVLESEAVFRLPLSSKDRPFFSPLIYWSKQIKSFKTFIVSGTGINFELITDLLPAGTMKEKVPGYEVISPLDPLDTNQIAQYSRQILAENNISQSAVEVFVQEVCVTEELASSPL